MSAYWLGVATPFAVGMALFVLTVAYFRVAATLRARGWFSHFRRDLKWPTDYDLRRDIWFERQVGPFFAGHWVHERSGWNQPTGTKVNRWVGIGARDRWGWFVGRSVPLRDEVTR